MRRSTLDKVVRTGRVTVFTVGLAVVFAVVLGIGSTALAAVPGDPFRLGKVNAINAVSHLVGSTTGSLLRLDNNGTGSALQLLVEPGRQPMTVNADAGKATNLNADKLDGSSSADFLPSEVYEKAVPETILAGSSAGTTASCDPGDVALSGGYAIADTGAYPRVLSGRRVDERFDAETGQVNPSGWHVVTDNPDATASATITVYVYCADRGPLHP